MAEISFQISPAPSITNDLIAVIYKTTASAAEIDRILDDSDHSSPQNFQFSNLDPGVYIVKIHESPDGTTLGNLRHDWWQDATTGQILFERRFYTVDGGGPNDPANGTNTITDPYFSGKNVTGIFQEAFRYLKPTTEWTQSSTTLTWGAGIVNSSGQVWSIEISYDVPPSPGGSSPFSDFEIVTTNTTLTTAHYNKNIFTRATGTKITITSPNISTIPEGTGFYIFHDGGNAINTIFQLPVGQIVRFRGQDLNNIVLGKGEKVKVLKKVISGTDYLLATDERGQWDRVGEIIPGRDEIDNGVYADGTEYDLNIYVRLGQYLDTLPPSLIKTYTDFNQTQVINGETVNINHGFFARDTVNNKAKVPNLLNQNIRFLKNIGGADANRISNTAGGYMHHSVGPHDHDLPRDASGASNIQSLVDTSNSDEGISSSSKTGVHNAGGETTGRNIGMIPILLI